MQLIVWITLCLGTAVLFRDRLIVVIVACLILWAAVPGVATSLLTGQPRGSSLAFHGATWLIVLTVAVQVLHDVRGLLLEVGRRIFTYLVLALFLAVAFLATKTSVSGSGLVLFFSQMLGPVLLFLLINVELRRNPGNMYRLRNWLVGIAAVESVLAIVEWSQGGVLLYREFYQTNYWFDEVQFPRWMGTLDHPLTLSLLLCAAVPLLAGIRRMWIQLPLLLLMAGGVLATQSRTGLGIVAIGLVYVLLTSRINVAAKAGSMLVIAVAGYFAASSALSAGVTTRLTDDGGSALARSAAFNFVLDHIDRFIFTGGGIGSASGVAEQGGLVTSLESSILIYAVDIGVAFALLYFGLQLVIVVRSFGRSTLPGIALAGLAVVIVPQTYNALNSQTFAGVLLWTVLAMAATMTSQRKELAAAAGPRATPTDHREQQLKLWNTQHPVGGGPDLSALPGSAGQPNSTTSSGADRR